MGTKEWLLWATALFLQQFTFLFSSRAKNSGSLLYSLIAGIGSHSTWFFANLFFVKSIMEFNDSPLSIQIGVCVFYVSFCSAGTQIAMRIARRIERGKMKIGA
jgi:hypothetical protein